MTAASTYELPVDVSDGSRMLDRAWKPANREKHFMQVCMFHCKRNAAQKDAAGCSSRCQGHAAFIESRDKRRDARRLLAATEASAALRRLNATGGPSICQQAHRPPLFMHRSNEIIQITSGQMWRYFSLVPCGSPRKPQLCLIFKKDVESSNTRLVRTSLQDGLAFATAPPAPPGDAEVLIDAASFDGNRASKHAERFIAHNLAILPLTPASRRRRDGRFAIVGGLGPATLTSNRRGAPVEGIRMTEGSGLPWHNTSWSQPRIIISGNMPSSCIDRRPSRLPLEDPSDEIQESLVLPNVPACEFDGSIVRCFSNLPALGCLHIRPLTEWLRVSYAIEELSLVHHRGEFRIFARANLREGSVRGGRFVQTTSSPDGRAWNRPWRLIRVRRLPPDKADVYLFHAQTNPVDESTLLALFPVSQPPHACVALSFSKDGIEWSTPHALMRCSLGWRTQTVDGFGPIEWRAEDHPVSGTVLSVATDEVWFYIHHEVHGMSMRWGAQRPAHVARYRMPRSRLRELTRTALRSLDEVSKRRKALG